MVPIIWSVALSPQLSNGSFEASLAASYASQPGLFKEQCEAG